MASEDSQHEFRRAALMFTYAFMACLLIVFIVTVDNFETVGSAINAAISRFNNKVSLSNSSYTIIDWTYFRRAAEQIHLHTWDFRSLTIHETLLANVFLCGFCAWLAALWLKKPRRIFSDALGYFGIFL